MAMQLGSVHYPALMLETKKKRSIPNEMRPEPNPAVLRASNEMWRNQKPNVILRSSTGS